MGFVTKDKYPTLFKAMEEVGFDNGMHREMEAKGELFVLASPDELQEAEDALKSLSREDLESLTIGDEDEVEEVASRTAALRTASNILQDFFDYEGDVHS